MKYFPILEMPEEIQALVVERVAGNSFQDLYGLRASCKLMKALADRRRVCVTGWEAGSMRWLGDGAILSVRMKTGWKDGEDGRLAVPFNPI
ncbi:hypothetical protein IGI04_035854 [Brassica rapa subsp. trilocularis]|uniref:F-box domain-containing protein n=1 Tax=Brassica rapa subsp. trilocularis TaxID=1813537 RepID=A0ABQ7LE38_BRACM|nr:hypothetical protein IGI04_035655 [Brassica rapa subsp. trilocularis]KAG5384384.1 hypothetical protein IGI04_035854 [Brassica rapa subsp. trilocularis]